jgi:hypothetical protein
VYYQPVYVDDPINSWGGECRKKLPKIYKDKDNDEHNFPMVEDTDWCGEHPDFSKWLEWREKNES